MKKLFVLFVVLALVLPTAAIATDFGQKAVSINANTPGPAPNSGDGIPDGPGGDFPPGPFGPASK